MLENRHGHGSMSLSADREDLGRTSYFRSRILSKGMIRGLQELCQKNTYVALPEETRMGANRERLGEKKISVEVAHGWEFVCIPIEMKIQEERFRKWARNHAVR